MLGLQRWFQDAVFSGSLLLPMMKRQGIDMWIVVNEEFHSDPVTEQILTGSQTDRSLYVLLTTLMQAGDPKLLRALKIQL